MKFLDKLINKINEDIKWRKVNSGKLFVAPDEVILAAQIKDSDEGCSASICSNCRTKIAYCDISCSKCKYPLIDAHGMPTMGTWKKLSAKQRKNCLVNAFSCMLNDMQIHGHDWRGIQDSPFNRYLAWAIKYNNFSA